MVDSKPHRASTKRKPPMHTSDKELTVLLSSAIEGSRTKTRLEINMDKLS